MASIHFRDGGAYGHDGSHGGADSPHPSVAVSKWATYAGALISAALIAGLGVWGYRLAVRDMSGVPVIRAMQGPSRMAPDDPGGDLARHVGLSVNAVAALGTAAPAPDQVVLAPRPAELDPADMPMAGLRPLLRTTPTAEAEEPAPEADTVAVAVAMPVPDSVSAEAARALALAEDLTSAAAAPAPTEVAAEMTPAEAAPAAEAAPEARPEAEVIPTSVPGVARSPRPLARPGTDLIAEAAALAVAEAMAPAPQLDLDPASLAAGTRLVQLGAFDSADLARAEWDKVAVRFDTLMAGKRRVIQEAASGGRTFYRLRVEGFADVADARRFCAALVAEQTNCIPAQVR